MADLPADIWLRISQFIPNKSLRGMIGINSIFFEMAMDARYKVISFTSFSPAEIGIIKRLADPLVACRVRTIHIHLEREIDSTYLQKLLQTSHLIHSNSSEKSAEARILYTKRLSSYKFHEGLADVFSGLCNLEEFIFDLCFLPSELDLQPFSLLPWPVLNNLRKLSLYGNLRRWGKMLDFQPSLDCLEELDLRFLDDNDGSRSVADTATLLDSVAPLIVRVSTQLTSLKLMFWTHVTDLSSFFKRLCPFPALRRLDIYAELNRSLHDDPSGLAILLSGSSSTLRYLSLQFSSAFDLAVLSAKPPFTEWLLRSIVSDLTISTGLQTLELSLPGDPGFEVLLICVQRSVSTLIKLSVHMHNRYLEFEEVEVIVQLFCSQKNPPLASLELNVSSLNAYLFDLLGNSLPELHHLKLNVGGIMHEDLRDFEWAMENRSFPNWKLYDIDIQQGGWRPDSITMASLAKSIPSIQRFRSGG